MYNHRQNIGVLISEPSRHQPASQLPESRFCRELCSHGAKLGLFVFLFRASSLKHMTDTLTGFVPTSTGWKAVHCPLPDVIYDRSIQRGGNSGLEKLKARHPFIFLNRLLPGKWAVYNALKQDPDIGYFLPPTWRYEGRQQLEQLAAEHADGLFLKPAAGSQGRGAVCMRREEEHWIITGRTLKNRSLKLSFPALAQCTAWIERSISSHAYIVQPYLKLSDQHGTAFDIRTLIQKDRHGNWSITGTALREGASGSITANLHGGGAAHSAQQALARRCGINRAQLLLEQIEQTSLQIAQKLEKQFGRLCELGLDFGVDHDGCLWFIEANSRPGRLCMRQVPDAAEQAALKPLQYALLLIKRSSPLVSVQCLVPAKSASYKEQ